MQKKALMLSLLGISAASVAAVATGVRPVPVAKVLPAAVQSPAQPVPVQPQRSTYMPTSAIGSSISRWNSLRQTDSLPFSSYASFLMSHRGWPGEAAMRRQAEKANADGASPRDVIAFFDAFPATTPSGHARIAFALLASGRVEEARGAARRAWTGGVLPRTDEDRLLSLFGGALSSADHDLRIETLLDNGDTQSAMRTLSLASQSQRPVYDARLALQTRAPDAASRLGQLSGAEGDAGLLIDRVRWMRNVGQSAMARQLMAQPRRLTKRPANPEKWLETLLILARGASEDNQWTTALQIALQADEAYEPGTDVSARPYGERDEYTSLVWLGGMAANRVGRPADAQRLFERYARAGRSIQVLTKGSYWAGRAAQAAGNAAQANAYFSQAANYPELFYGQLSLERLGRTVPAPRLAPTLSEAERSAFERRNLVEATRQLGLTGQRQDQAVFIRALSEQLESERERALATDFAPRIGRQDLAVWVNRSARNEGAPFYVRGAYPEVSIPAAQSHIWSIAHGIVRQESSFDRTAVSHAGARGMMQLMPPTARELAGKMGLPYDFGRLTSDPEYNVTLGSRYLQQMIDYWGGSVPLAVASYNAGPGNVAKWVRQYGDPRTPGVDIVRWIEEIPFTETRGYVQRVLEHAVVYDTIHPSRARSPERARLSYYLGKSGRPG